ncbi:prepilin-type N-terminal cleavage/methylation domain-containing protein [Dyella amyloliquefaciens]|uniref:prepilin-type N-terminal cleavage/methylation domain-containing protein n=1 Tax=Dyella amyloliquefaciens TaxID=1770545 RepID=UPI00102EA459|nr:prepilin-type N-terminal cleavage/methylation domain-containing protein [Dyella amyloliquefaciens]
MSTRRMQGFTLVELMVAMVLGLVVIGGVVSVFLANQQVYRTNKAMSDVQGNSRIAFELMARDARTAGLTGCGNASRIANVVNNNTAAANWFVNWTAPVAGYAASQTDPVAGTDRTGSDSLVLLGAEGSGVSVKTDTASSATIVLNEAKTSLAAGDFVVICDPDHAVIAQLSGVSGSTLTHAKTGTPGNCTLDLSYPTVCASSNTYTFSANALVARLTASSWYVGTNAVNGSSLFRKSLGPGGTLSTDEMVRDVSAMSLQYHQSGDVAFVTADNVTNWPSVDALQITLTTISVDQRAGVNAAPISRTFTSTTTLRNRVQ